jgi:hypothetical protein
MAARAAALAARTSDARSAAYVACALGKIAASEGKWAEALRSFELAERGQASVGDATEVDHARRLRGSVLAGLGRFEAAEEIFLAPPVGPGPGFQAYTDHHLAELCIARGDVTGALAAWQRAIGHYREAGIENDARVVEVNVAVVEACAAPTAALRARLLALRPHAQSMDGELIALVCAGLALTGGMDARKAAATIESLRRRMSVKTRMQCAWILWRAAGDPRQLRAAHADLRRVVANAPFEDRATMVTRVALHRAIAEAVAERGRAPQRGARATPSERRDRSSGRDAVPRVRRSAGAPARAPSSRG